MPPLQVDEGKKGKDSDHQIVVFDPKTDPNIVEKKEKLHFDHCLKTA